MDLIYVGIIVVFGLFTHGLMKICEVPGDHKPGVKSWTGLI